MVACFEYFLKVNLLKNRILWQIKDNHVFTFWKSRLIFATKTLLEPKEFLSFQKVSIDKEDNFFCKTNQK